MTDIGLHLLDTGSCFTLISQDIQADLPYGVFTVSFINMSFQNIKKLLLEYICENFDELCSQDRNAEENSAFIKLTELLFYELRIDYIEQSGLSKIVSLLLKSEIYKASQDQKTRSIAPIDLVPTIFIEDSLYDYAKNMITNQEADVDKSLQTFLQEIPITSTIDMTANSTSFQRYYIEDLLQFLLLDIYRFRSTNVTLLECQCCHRLFIPKKRCNEKYCNYDNGACKKAMKRSNTSSLAKERDKYRAYQHSVVFRDSTQAKFSSSQRKKLSDLYFDWSEMCTKKYNEFALTNDHEGFENWFHETKFTAKRLEEIINDMS